jgi:hypothetical protein
MRVPRKPVKRVRRRQLYDPPPSSRSYGFLFALPREIEVLWLDLVWEKPGVLDRVLTDMESIWSGRRLGRLGWAKNLELENRIPAIEKPGDALVSHNATRPVCVHVSG